MPTPWLCLQGDLRDAGIDPSAMLASGRVRTDLTMAQQLLALRSGDLDVAQCFEPHVSQALADGTGRLLCAASARGPVVYTTFICSRDGLARRREAFAGVNRALHALQDWMAAHGAAELARITAPFFPEVPRPIFNASVERYFAAGVWARRPDVSTTGFDRLAHCLHTGGFTASPASHAACVHRFDAQDRD